MFKYDATAGINFENIKDLIGKSHEFVKKTNQSNFSIKELIQKFPEYFPSNAITEPVYTSNFNPKKGLITDFFTIPKSKTIIYNLYTIFEMMKLYLNLECDSEGTYYGYDHTIKGFNYGIKRVWADKELYIFWSSFKNHFFGYLNHYKKPTVKATEQELIAIINAQAIPAKIEHKINPAFYTNYQNGIYDWKKERLLPHTENLIFTHQHHLAYQHKINPKYDHIQKNILEAIFKPEDIEHIKIFIGSLLLGREMASSDIRPIILFFLGEGGNGKGLFCNFLGKILGQNYVSHVQCRNLENRSENKPLATSKLNIIEEPTVRDFTRYWSDLKNLSSGGYTAYKDLWKNTVTFQSKASFILSFNEWPEFEENMATFRRCYLFHFEKSFEHMTEKATKEFWEKVQAELMDFIVDCSRMYRENEDKLLPINIFQERIMHLNTPSLSLFIKKFIHVHSSDIAEGHKRLSFDEGYQLFCSFCKTNDMIIDCTPGRFVYRFYQKVKHRLPAKVRQNFSLFFKNNEFHYVSYEVNKQENNNYEKLYDYKVSDRDLY